MERATGVRLRIAAPEPNRNPLDEFGDESKPEPESGGPAGDEQAPRPRRNWIVWVLGIVILVQMPIVALWLLNRSGAGSTGTVVIESTPPGAEVRQGGRGLGATPLELSLAPGDVVLDVQLNGVVRQVPVTVRSGETVRQRIEFVNTPTTVATTAPGAISVTTDGARAPVFVDGLPRGISPVVVTDLIPGDHLVSVRFPGGAVDRLIRVEPGSTASLAATPPAVAGASSGWMAVNVTQPLQIFEDTRLIGTTEISRLMLPAGSHTLDFVNDELGFRVRRAVSITPGSTTNVTVELPRAPLSINAQPWASVWVDGEAVGDTPIGNLTPTIGRHEVLFRHPQLGERRTSVLVTLKAPARVGMDLRQPN